MAEGGGNWFSHWVNSAKQTSANVLEFMKKDLDEFTSTVQQESKTVMSHVTESLKEKLQMDKSDSATNKVKRSMSSFLGSVSQALNPETKDNEEEICVIRDNEPVVMDRLQAKLYTLQRDPSTFLEDSKDPDYAEWTEKFDLESRSTELSDILVENVSVQEMYTKLVPSSVSHVHFWNRYFFRVNQVLLAEERKRELVERAANAHSAENISWDDIAENDAFGGNKDLPDHVADKLLEDYAKECEERKLSVSSSTSSTARVGSKLSPSNDSGVSCNNSAVVSYQGDVTANKSLAKDDSGLSLNCSTSNESSIADPALITREKGDMVVVGVRGISSESSSRTSPSSSNGGTEEWEDNFELDDESLPKGLTNEEGGIKEPSATTASKEVPEEEDWETWE